MNWIVDCIEWGMGFLWWLFLCVCFSFFFLSMIDRLGFDLWLDWIRLGRVGSMGWVGLTGWVDWIEMGWLDWIRLNWICWFVDLLTVELWRFKFESNCCVFIVIDLIWVVDLLICWFADNWALKIKSENNCCVLIVINLIWSDSIWFRRDLIWIIDLLTLELWWLNLRGSEGGNNENEKERKGERGREAHWDVIRKREKEKMFEPGLKKKKECERGIREGKKMKNEKGRKKKDWKRGGKEKLKRGGQKENKEEERNERFVAFLMIECRFNFGKRNFFLFFDEFVDEMSRKSHFKLNGYSSRDDFRDISQLIELFYRLSRDI